jgi:hypothetical protein
MSMAALSYSGGVSGSRGVRTAEASGGSGAGCGGGAWRPVSRVRGRISFRLSKGRTTGLRSASRRASTTTSASVSLHRAGEPRKGPVHWAPGRRLRNIDSCGRSPSTGTAVSGVRAIRVRTRTRDGKMAEAQMRSSAWYGVETTSRRPMKREMPVR